MSPRRARRRTPDTPILHRITAVLLRYPDEAMLTCLDDVAAALPAIRTPADRTRLTAACDHLRRLTPTKAAERYVDTFDHTRRRSLHLTYYRHGDTRARGMALLALKHAYRQAGHEPPEAELPDFLRLILEFAALAREPGHCVLLQCRAGTRTPPPSSPRALHRVRRCTRHALRPTARIGPTRTSRLAAAGHRGTARRRVRPGALRRFSPQHW
jgi:nitrate reductase delta subunit